MTERVRVRPGEREMDCVRAFAHAEKEFYTRNEEERLPSFEDVANKPVELSSVRLWPTAPHYFRNERELKRAIFAAILNMDKV